MPVHALAKVVRVRTGRTAAFPLKTGSGGAACALRARFPRFLAEPFPGVDLAAAVTSCLLSATDVTVFRERGAETKRCAHACAGTLLAKLPCSTIIRVTFDATTLRSVLARTGVNKQHCPEQARRLYFGSCRLCSHPYIGLAALYEANAWQCA